MGERVNSDRVNYGLNQDLTGYSDAKYVRCSRCGYINNLDRSVRGRDGSWMGWGTDLSSTTTASGTIDPVVRNGCVFCGTYLYNK